MRHVLLLAAVCAAALLEESAAVKTDDPQLAAGVRWDQFSSTEQSYWPQQRSTPRSGRVVEKFAAISIVDANTRHAAGLSTVIGTVARREVPLFRGVEVWESHLNNGYPNVVYSREAGRSSWQLWYGGCSSANCSVQFLMYANSSDGLEWTKPQLRLFNASELFPTIPRPSALENNIVMTGGGLGIYRDQHEPDAAKRYKLSGGSPAACFANKYQCVSGTAASPDGISGWQVVQNFSWPPPWRSDCHTNLYFDVSLGQYVLTTRDMYPYVYNNVSTPGRAIGIARSKLGGSFVFEKAPRLAEAGTHEEQLYSQITFRFYNILLGIVMVLDYHKMEEVGHGHVHCRLTWSADAGATWKWADEGGLTGKDFIPAGPPGSFDSYICFAANAPLVAPDGLIRLYLLQWAIRLCILPLILQPLDKGTPALATHLTVIGEENYPSDHWSGTIWAAMDLTAGPETHHSRWQRFGPMVSLELVAAGSHAPCLSQSADPS